MPTKKLITPEDLYALQFVEDPQISPDGKYIAFVKVTVEKVGNKYTRNIWLATLAGDQPRVRQFTFGDKSDTAPRWSPDGRTLAFVSARAGKPQIYLIGLEGGEARPLTAQPNGASNPVWSPAGTRLAFLSSVSAEERQREDAGKTEPPPATALEAKHQQEQAEAKEKAKLDPRVISRLPYRGGTEYFDDRFSHIYVMDVPDVAAKPGQAYRLTDGDLDFGVIEWTPDGSAIISSQSRQPEHEPRYYTAVVRLVATGKRKPYKLLSPSGHEYFEPRVSPDGKWIATTRVGEDGSFGQQAKLTLLPTAGGAAQELTTALDRSIGDLCWSADSKWVYFAASDRGAVGVYRAGVASGAVEHVIAGARMAHGYSLDRAGGVAFVASTPTNVSDVYLVKGKAEQQITDFNAAWQAGHVITPIEEVWHTAPDGRKIQGWLMKPVGFRKGAKHPLVVHMHGGPWVMWGASMPAMWLEWQVHAARGYGVYFCNPRGSEGYGEEHALTIRNDWGDHVMRDILSGLDNVARRGWVDPKRLALTGGSYAGYMTAWIVSHDQRFACAWAQRGLYNLISFSGTSDIPQLIEREFETMGFDDIEKLWKQSPLAYVRNIRTPLAIEHQDNDWRCPPSEAEQLFAALKRLRRTVVMYRYPREGHEMSRGGEPAHRVDRLHRMTAWFDKYCKKGRG